MKNSIQNKKFYLLDEENIYASCRATTIEKARQIFTNNGWKIGIVWSEEDFINENALNSFENQPTE